MGFEHWEVGFRKKKMGWEMGLVPPPPPSLQDPLKDAKKYIEELDLQLWLNFPNPVAVADEEVEAKKVKQATYKSRQQEIQSTVSEERW